MHHRYSTVSFLSDYGTGDEFVGVVKSVIRSIEPEAAVIDITHEIPPHDVRAGSLALARAVQYWSALTTACWQPRWGWSGGPTG
jgi:S-adenosylmethionine hydrolase